MNIREACMDDLDVVTEIERVCFPPEEAASRESLMRRLEVYPSHFWLLCVDDMPVAFLNGLVTDEEHLTDEMFADASMHDESGAWQMIFGVDTMPGHRRRGYATRLIAHAASCARKQGRKGMVLTCKEHLVHFYARSGFIDEGISGSQHGGAVWHEMRLIF